MQIFEVINERRSIRAYKDEPIEKEKIDRLIESARLAPTAANRQKFKLVIVNYEEKDLKNKLVTACNEQQFVGMASNIIAGVSEEPDYKWEQVDLAIVLEHIVLEAVELGLGTCWIGAFKENEVKKLLKIPKDKRVVALLAIGYPAENPPARPRKDISELISYNQY